MGEGEVSYTRTYMVDKLLVFAPKDKVEGVTDPESRAVVIYEWSSMAMWINTDPTWSAVHETDTADNG